MGKVDVMGAALLRKYELLASSLILNQFRTMRNGWSWDEKKALMWFYVSKKLPLPFEKRKGPRVTDKVNSLRFKQKHKHTFVKRGRLFVKAKRRFTTPAELVKFVVRQSNFRRKIKTVRVEWH